MKFTINEYKSRSIKSGCKSTDFTDEIIFNASRLIEKINKLGYQPPKVFSSCLRSKKRQIEIYKAKGVTDISKIPMGSSHLTGRAVDIADDGKLQKWIKTNVKKAEELGLYFEDFAYTKNWVHVQDIAPKSGKRFFIP